MVSHKYYDDNFMLQAQASGDMAANNKDVPVSDTNNAANSINNSPKV